MNIDKNMEFKSEQKYLLISPRKLRPIVDLIKKIRPVNALEKLPFIKRRGAMLIAKVIKSALANAEQKGVLSNNLVFKEIQITEGPRLKRGQPVSRGRWHPIKKRMSHIRVVLITRIDQVTGVKSQVKTKVVKGVKKGTKRNGTKN